MMTTEAPYQRGDQAIWLEADERGLRAYRAEVVGVSQEAYDLWSVATTHGHERVDSRGEGPRLLPMDPELAEDLASHGDGYLIEPTVRDDLNLDQSIEQNDLGKGGRER